MKALILVGGFGTRLRPLTLSVPKPVVPFANKEMVIHQIEALVEAGVDEVILAVNYRPEMMEGNLAKWEKKLNVKFTYSQETEPLGTAGPLALAKDILTQDDEPFFVLNSDVMCTYPLKELLAFHKSHGSEGTIFVTKVEDPSKYGVVVSDGKGQIERFVEKPKIFISNKINAGLYVFNTSILKRIKPRPTSIEKEIFPEMCREGQLYSMVLPGFWMDVGQPKDFILGTCLYLKNLRQTAPERLQKGDNISGPVFMDPTSTIAAGCLLGPNVTIGANVTIKEGARIKNAVIMEGCVVGENAFIDHCIVGWRSTIGPWARLENVSVLGEDVNVASEVWINGSKVLPHKSISASIPEPTVVL
eukprot:CAMPEP_0119121090 /NCGR_PEP_ID=MMETSP1310-20130426/1867_1 /TAXON_ID=464262 /ORGANISM="Genus nov. species nov., Strain RCC2339" /LENGTH=359 /DNA_ID=CAMNT_0007110629 /DNA_START=181 /DNA_END=1260 /DNA_ORIENTATION=+